MPNHPGEVQIKYKFWIRAKDIVFVKPERKSKRAKKLVWKWIWKINWKQLSMIEIVGKRQSSAIICRSVWNTCMRYAVHVFHKWLNINCISTSLLSVVRMSAVLTQLCLLVLSMVAGATLGCPGDVLECPAMVGWQPTIHPEVVRNTMRHVTKRLQYRTIFLKK